VGANEEVQSKLRRRRLTILLPLTVTGVVFLLDLGDKSGPHHGQIRLALSASVFVATVGAWLSPLWEHRVCWRR